MQVTHNYKQKRGFMTFLTVMNPRFHYILLEVILHIVSHKMSKKQFFALAYH